MAEQRSLPVPDGLEGERLDAALSRLFGLSRTRAAELIVGGDVLVDGSLAAKSDRVHAGRLAGGRPCPPPPDRADAGRRAGARHAHRVRGRRHRRGQQAHRAWRPTRPSAGPGPTVIGGLLGAGHRGRDQRRGRAPGHRAPAGRQHHRRDGRRQERARLLPAEAGLQGTHGRKALPRAGPGAPRSAARHGGRADRPPPVRGRPVRGRGGGQGVGHPLRHDRGVPRGALLDIKLETGRTHQIRVHMSALRHPCVGDMLYGADPTSGRAAGGAPAVAARDPVGVRPPHAVPPGGVHQLVSGGFGEVAGDSPRRVVTACTAPAETL